MFSDEYRFRIALAALGTSPIALTLIAVSKWQWPDWLDGVTGDDFNKAAAAIRAGKWRANSQADDWVGIAAAKVLDLRLTVKQERAKVLGLIQAWKKSGALIQVKRIDEKQRKERLFVGVAETAEDADDI